MIRTRDILILLCIAIVSVLMSTSLYQSSTLTNIRTTESLVIDSSVHFDVIQSIVIHKQGKDFQFEKRDGHWWQVLPFKTEMDSASIQALIRAVEGVQVIGQLPPSVSTSILNLDENANGITMSDGTETVSIRLGRKTLGGRAYAQIDNSAPVVIDQSLHRRAIDMDSTLWRDARLFPEFSIHGVRIERVVHDDRLILDRSSGRWEMLEPVSARIDHEMLLEWVGRIASARMSSFVVDEPSDLNLFGLQNPVASFSVSDRNGLTRQVLIGGRVSAGSEDRYVMIAGTPVVCKIRWETLSPLLPAPEIFVDATGSAVSRFDIKQIAIKTDANDIILNRNLDQWLNAEGVPFDVNKVQALLTWLLDTKPPSVAIGQYPRVDQIAAITLIGYDQRPLDTIRIALDQSGGIILENGDNVLRLHPQESIEALAPFVR